MIDRDTVVQLARNAGFLIGAPCSDGVNKWDFVAPPGNGCIVELERFAQAVTQKAVEGEREACEMAVEGIAQAYSEDSPGRWMANKCLQAIRNRGIGGGE